MRVRGRRAFLQNSKDRVVWQAICRCVVEELAGLGVESIQTTTGANPERALLILIDRPDRIVAQATGVLRVMFIARKGLGIAMEVAEPTTGGAHPECARPVLVDGIDDACPQATGVRGVVLVAAEAGLPVL